MEMNMSRKPYEQQGVATTCRSYREYLDMFSLDEQELAVGLILDVAGGASGFTSGACAGGADAYAADPLYAMDPKALYEHAALEIDISANKLMGLSHQYDWSYYGNINRHKNGRIQTLEQFYEHFMHETEAGTGRYQAAFLPNLPYADESFKFVLCSHFLFLYYGPFDRKFHESALFELLRVCQKDGEIRVYPLLSLKWEVYPFLEETVSLLKNQGFRVDFVETGLRFMPDSLYMLRVAK